MRKRTKIKKSILVMKAKHEEEGEEEENRWIDRQIGRQKEREREREREWVTRRQSETNKLELR